MQGREVWHLRRFRMTNVAVAVWQQARQVTSLSPSTGNSHKTLQLSMQHAAGNGFPMTICAVVCPPPPEMSRWIQTCRSASYCQVTGVWLQETVGGMWQSPTCMTCIARSLNGKAVVKMMSLKQQSLEVKLLKVMFLTCDHLSEVLVCRKFHGGTNV